ncbi:MAG: 5-methyltetrahydropteroyltriglutamate--homocysteine S-methyltransferase [Anaerolineaceae bacterium]|jgi:5-methyltetrahydropteroyltriglutamate--homocysteine methyltransferase|nr:5-methyltetrahydropteroyltriglutamate--homocysteine S-methyltransferase [Anaerolineaceae bacterium]
MTIITNLGYPRIGLHRELKKALEGYWKGNSSQAELLKAAAEIRKTNWQLQAEAGIAHIPSNDFSLYDQVLDTIVMAGAVPVRYKHANGQGHQVDLDTYFAMARGVQNESGLDIPAMEMTKWFDTNYHYIVPELAPDQHFHLASSKVVDEYNEAKALGIQTRPVLLGPVSFLLLSKSTGEGKVSLDLLEGLLPVYEQVLSQLAEAGAEWVQMDEPYLMMDLSTEEKAAFERTYQKLEKLENHPRLLVATYFGALLDNLDLALHLPVDALHLDLVRAPEQLAEALEQIPDGLILSLGVVDGRNIWRTDLEKAAALVQQAVDQLGADRVWVAPSCSLLHVPQDLALETELDEELRSWLAFAHQKLGELTALGNVVSGGSEKAADALRQSRLAAASRETSRRIHNPKVGERLSSLTPAMRRRNDPYAVRKKAQADLGLPLLPTTTIGSFPQTKEVRQNRSKAARGQISPAEYEAFVKEEIKRTIRFQEEAGLDVLVHGEAERNDMVQYFGEQLDGFAFTRQGWVQSYGSRYVRPPVIFGDVHRPQPMTVKWAKYAQSVTDRHVKGMLTGPITILQWSFVRDDQPRADTCRQIALAIRDEVHDLEAAGIRIIQIDEPALREGLPLRAADRAAYLRWAVDSFHLSADVVENRTQIHTHMCYSEFNEIIDSIAAMDADVISIEASRSKMELLDAFVNFHYPNEIGPGVYDIHSPRVPSQEEMEDLLRKALEVIPAERLWVNPDCGLKTRGWAEVEPALKAMVAAAKTLRAAL